LSICSMQLSAKPLISFPYARLKARNNPHQVAARGATHGEACRK
jgi:hypothetical protein